MMTATMAALNDSFRIGKDELETRLGVSLKESIDGNQSIVPLRELTRVDDIVMLRKPVLEALVRGIPLRGTTDKPYKNATIDLYTVGAGTLSVGQTFVQKTKLLGLLQLQHIFHNHLLPGLASMGPARIYGIDRQGLPASAFYVPPIVELHENKTSLLDGAHRSYLSRSLGSTITTLRMGNVDAPLPFTPIGWEDVHAVDEKPDIDKRFVGLRRSYFRDLRYVGVDG